MVAHTDKQYKKTYNDRVALNRQAWVKLLRTKVTVILKYPPVCCHLFVVGGLRASMTRRALLAGVFILLLGPPKPDRLKDRGQTK